MSAQIENLRKEERTSEETDDFKKTRTFRKYLKDQKFILLNDLGKALGLDKSDSDYILTKIMHSFWDGEMNLFSLPWLYKSVKIPRHSEILINGKATLEINIISRELFRNLLRSEIQGKKRTTKRPDLLSKQFDYIDGSSPFYKTFLAEDWGFYHRIINRMNRVFRQSCKQFCSDTKSMTNDQKIKIAGNYFIKLYIFNTLAVEINDLIKSIQCCSTGLLKRSTEINKTLNSFKNISDIQKIKEGHAITNEFLFDRYLEIKREHTKLPDREIAKELYKKYFEDSGLDAKIASFVRVRKIISEQKNKSIKRHFKVLISHEKFSYLTNTYFSTFKHIKKLHQKWLKNNQ